MNNYQPYTITRISKNEVTFIDRETGESKTFNSAKVMFEIIRKRFNQEIKTPSDCSPFWFPTMWQCGSILKDEISIKRYQEIFKESENEVLEQMQEHHEIYQDEESENWLQMFADGDVRCQKKIKLTAWRNSIFEYAKI